MKTQTKTKSKIRRPVKHNPIQAKAHKAATKKPWKWNHKHHPRQHRNPSMPSILSKPIELLKAGAVGAIAYFATRQVPQLLLKSRNTSWLGYLANLITALASAGAADKYFGPMAGTAAFVGGGMYLVARVTNDQTPFGAALNLQGLGDPAAVRGLRGIVPGYWAQPPTVQRDGTPIFPPQLKQYIQAQIPAPFPAAAPAGAAAGFSGGRFSSRF